MQAVVLNHNLHHPHNFLPPSPTSPLTSPQRRQMLNAAPVFFQTLKQQPDAKYFYGMASTRSPPVDDWSQNYGMSNSLDAPSPPPTVGQPLLDPQQQIYFDQFFEMPSNMIPSINPAHVFQPELPKDAAVYWPEELQQHHYQTTPDQEYLPETTSGYLSSSSAVSTAPAMNTPRIDINPFEGSHELMRRDHSQLNPPSLLTFGSDTNFAPNGYQAPPHPSPLDKDGEIQSKIFSALSRQDSNMTTAVNSPVSIKYERTGEDTEDDYSQLQDGESPSPSASSCMKRRAEDGEDFTSSKSARKPRPRPLDIGAGMGMGMKMKKKAMGQKRDNLTESQKRENHIHSEQKRRNLIRQGFDELCSLVPELKAGGYSKSAVLVHAANYLADLKSGNARLHQYVDQLERGLRYR